MARRKAPSASPKPAKRTRVARGKSAGGSDDEDELVAAVSAAQAVPPARPERPERPERPRRPAATKAAAATSAAIAADDGQSEAAASVPPREQIHEALFAPMTAAELAAWQGWAEIESEPAFFNFILCQLGIEDATIHELFGVDEASISYLPDPLGLIFLYRFVDEDESEVHEDCPDSLWFANQTTSNACGTIAMLNIAMNCGRLRLGDYLARFKAATQAMHPALRGHLLSNDADLRSAHNAFARRLDMLMSDLTLKLEWLDSTKKRKKNKIKQTSSSRRKTRKKRDDRDDAAFHFIAYVPMGHDVWELNGMQEKPYRLGNYNGDWTAIARERIATRMSAYAPFDDTAIFSLLALCHTPREEKDGDAGNETKDDGDGDDDGRRAAARKRDYTPAVHCWLKKLADKGVLRRLATGEDDKEEEKEEKKGEEDSKKADKLG